MWNSQDKNCKPDWLQRQSSEQRVILNCNSDYQFSISSLSWGVQHLLQIQLNVATNNRNSQNKPQFLSLLQQKCIRPAPLIKAFVEINVFLIKWVHVQAVHCKADTAPNIVRKHYYGFLSLFYLICRDHAHINWNSYYKSNKIVSVHEDTNDVFVIV